ncbi:serine-protein kinase ATM [Halyomorpha halys]|uniref:serine-protein kinase ATM n=1 Tax=Halyomorpha halys TaxID=286706 RepID=UPI0006D501DC|nr:serine-protein kinase ATM [Halyomorpha halys]
MDITRLGIDISDSCNYLDSNKVTERKKRILELKQLLEIPRSIELLNENSEKERGLCWDNVFSAAHRCLLKEIDRLTEEETKKGKPQPATELAISSCCGLQVLIVTQANTGTPYLACHELFSCILQILEQYSCSYKSTVVLEAYINILGIALSCEKYWGEIDFQIWKALLQVCVSLLRLEISEKIKAMLMSIINIIILQGGRMTSLILKSKSLLSLFPEIFNELVPSRYPAVELSGIQLSHTMCLQFGKEFHLGVDKFIDEIFPIIMKLNDNRVSSDTVFKELTSQLLITIVSIKTLKSDWQKEANSLVKFVENELADISKHRLVFPKEPQVVTLGVKLAKYLAKKNGKRSEFQESEPKRRKTNTFIGGVLDNLYMHPHCPSPWLSYLDNLLEKVPEVVLEEDISPLMEYFSKNMTLINDPTCLQYMTMSSLRLMNISKDRSANKSFSDFLNFLWTTAMRFVNHPKLREVGLTLVLNLLSNEDWINFDSAMSVLELYIDYKIEVTETSLKTLSQFCAAGFLPTTDTRIKLIHWYFSGEIYSTDTLLCLILRSKFPCLIPTLQTDFPFTEIEQFYFIATLDVVPTSQMRSAPDTDCLNDKIEDKTVFLEFMQLLPNKLKEVNSLHQSLNITTSLLSLSNSFKKYNLIVCTRFTDILTQVVSELLIRIKESLLNMNNENLLSLILEAKNFFEELAKFPNSFLNSDNSLEILNVLLEQLKLQHISVCDIQEKPSMKRIDILKNESNEEEQPVKILYTILAFLKSFSSEDKLKTFIHLISYCKNNISLASKSGFRIASILLQHMISSQVGSKELLKSVISLITKLCNKWYTYYEEVLQVLQLIIDTIPPMLLFDKERELNTPLHRLLSSFSKRICKKRYGPEIILKYVSVLAKICECDTDGVHIIDHENGKKQHILYYMLEFLNSSFHQVRIATCEHITMMFNSEVLTSERISFLNQAFNIVLSAVSNLFLVKEGKSPDEVREEALNRTGCVLKIFLSLICSSPLWRRKALYELFNTIAVKNISQNHFDKIHHYLERNMKIENGISFFEQNLDYVLWEWYKNHKSFEKIPYLLLKFKKIEEFYAEYKSIIVPIFLESLNIKDFQDFCGYLNSSPQEVATECFPEILSCLIPKLGTNLQNAVEFQHIITKILGPNIKGLMSTELKVILLNVFMKLSDREYLNKLCGLDNTLLPSATPFNTTWKGLENALEYIQRTTPEPREFLLIFLCNNYPNYIQYIMHNLLAHVHLATTKEIRSLCCLQFLAIVDGLITELTKIKSMAGFLVRHTFHALLYFLNTDIALLAIHYLYRFVEIALCTSAELVDYFIDIIYPAIFKISQGKGPLADGASKIIKLLISSRANLPSLISLLSPTETSLSLSKEIDIILQRQSIDYQDLDRLLLQLEKSQKDLSTIFKEIKSSRYSTEDCAVSLIHKLISKLVILATSSDDEIKDRAAECLGRIGPRNLHTLALQPDLDKESPPLSAKVVSLLLPLLVHNDLETCELAVTAILEVFETKEGLEAYDALDNFKKMFLTPFIYHSKKTKVFSKDYSVQKLAWASMQDSEGLSKGGWSLWSGSDHSEWVRMVVSRLLTSFDDGFLPLLAPLAAKEVKVSEELLPYVTDIIMENHEHCPEALLIIQRNVSCFFENHFRLHQSGRNIEDGTSIYFNRKSVQCMLNIINFCRVKTAALSRAEWMNMLRKLNVNFLHVAYAAQFCRAYFTSLLYAEIWTEYIKEEIEKEIPKHITLAPLDLICRTRPEEGILILNLLWENYKEIGESDSVESCARLLISDPQARMRYFKEMGLWQKLVAEAEVENDHEALSHGLLMSGMFTCASRVQGYGWEASWRLMQWNIEQPQKVNKDFSSLHYSALRSILHLKDKQSALIFLESAKKLVLSDLTHASLEVAASVYLPLAKLQLVSELETWCTNQEANPVIPDANWIHIEPLLMQRGLLWGEAQQWLSTAKIARNNSSLLIARSLINKIKKSDMPKELRNEAKFEEAQIHWESGSSEAAKFLLKNLLNHDLEPHLKLKCLLKYGYWMSETKSQSAKEIIEDYFKKASDLSMSCDVGRLEAAECLAKFSDTEFQRLDRYLRSSEYENKVSHMRDTKENLKAFQSCPSKLNNEELKSSKIYQCNLDIDKAEIETICKEHSAFLKLAVREYLYTLQHDASSSDKVFRFVSLWLSNNRMPGLKEELDKHLDKVPSYRFVPVFPQLSVRISLESSHFSRMLTSLLERCSTEHPHHCLWHLLALANAEKDQPKSNIPPPPRVQGSIKLLSNIVKSSAVGKIVKSMQDLALAYISFANLELPKTIKPSDSFKIPKNEKLREMRDMTHIASATVTVPISKSADYSNIPGLVAVEDAFQIAGGINQPKKIKVLSSDGKVKTELVKGRDDIRQDALMQQVFSVLNTLLESDEVTSRRRLNIRTYKVVPMTQKSGVIEWCSDTEPLGLYLSQAHSRHRPHDMSQTKCKINLQNVAQKSNEEKLEMFKIICSKFKPVMRHFFLERYLTPGVWYEKRLAFTRSVATNSMIGYVMGIGDRHVFNILIDKETAEVIHIDFGISFELGRILPTPETVPFRLTRDIEDGMGITGVEGAFRKCCEETLRVLRKKSEPILTTLEALLYDPLYNWSVKKPKSEQSQQSIPDISMDETNKLAERFLQRLQLKLEGREDSGISSIEAQVRNLIIEAKDPNNLSRLFRGWQAYL